jgi:hypothetical protein
MAHKKGGGSSRNGRDSHAKRLGVKKYGGEHWQYYRATTWDAYQARHQRGDGEGLHPVRRCRRLCAF